MKTAEEIVREKGTKMVNIAPTETLAKALEIMVDKDVGSIVAMEAGTVKGIWTERELMRSAGQPGFDLKQELVSNHMKKKIDIVDADEPIYRLSDKLLGIRTRYLFVQKDKKIIGLLSAGDVIRACLIEKTEQLKSMGLEYYENWKHD